MSELNMTREKLTRGGGGRESLLTQQHTTQNKHSYTFNL
jgi:hypothetical protein